jgi:hypothetical protein
MPWDANNGGTGLFGWCRVVLLWFVQVDPSQVERRSGSVNPESLADVIARRARARDFGPPGR